MMFTISKMIKQLILLILISSGANGSTTQKPDERTFKGWMVEVRSPENSGFCYGLFLGPQVLLTSLLCLARADENPSIFVIKLGDDSWRTSGDIPVNVNDIFFGRGLNKDFRLTDGMYALLRTQKPMIPDREVNENTFVKIAEDISEVNLKECSLLIGNHTDAYFEDCNVRNANSLKNTDDIIQCSIGHLETVHETIGLFCSLNEDVGTKVLVGLAFDSFMWPLDSEESYLQFSLIIIE